VYQGCAYLLAVACAVAAAPPSSAAVSSKFSSSFPTGQGTLRVESDGSDAVSLACSGGFVVVNGRQPDTGPVACSRVNGIDVFGGPGDNLITVSGSLPASTLRVFRGLSGRTSIRAGAGDDVVIGPSAGLAELDGGPGSDVLEGRTLDRYVFGPTDASELDTIVEPLQPACYPSFFESNQRGRVYWTVPWDSADFTSLPREDPVTLDAALPGGIFAMHRNRTIRLERVGVAIEAVAGGAGNDRLAGGCMVVGGPGDDRLAGGKDGDLLLGGLGDDELDGRGGPDTLNGGPGRDRLQGGEGADALAGMEGGDSLQGGPGGDVYLFTAPSVPEVERIAEERTAGVDVLSLAVPSEAAVVANLGARGEEVATAPRLTVRTDAGEASRFEGIIGGAGSDRLVGNSAANHFWSGGGDDFVAGGRGDDVYHADWVADMPRGAYGYMEEPWGGPFDRGVPPTRLSADRESGTPFRSKLRILERRNAGVDTIDLAEGSMSSPAAWIRLEGHVRGARVDLSASRLIMRTRWIEVMAARRGVAANLERIRGTSYRDVLIGNAAANVLEGRQDRDLVAGGRGRDTCLTYRREDRLRGCERIRPRDPDR
jgi:Ca2+-binding RTX toxin-like protein